VDHDAAVIAGRLDQGAGCRRSIDEVDWTLFRSRYVVAFCYRRAPEACMIDAYRPDKSTSEGLRRFAAFTAQRRMKAVSEPVLSKYESIQLWRAARHREMRFERVSR
jgi:hypothetical protein